MFQLDVLPTIPSVPWNEAYKTRLQALIAGDCRVAFYYGKLPDYGTFRYRVYNMVMSLRSLGKGISASFFYGNELENLADIFNNADIIVVCRTKYCNRLGHAITVARNKGKQVVFDIDDLLFDSRYIHLALKTTDADYTREDIWQNWYGDCARFSATLSLCDRVITTNTYLADKIRSYSGKEVSVMPNYLNEQQLMVSRKIYQKKSSSFFLQSKPVYLGYFSGSSTHNLDFCIITDALVALFEKYKNLKLRIVGLLDLDKKLKSYSDRIELHTIQDYLNLQRSIGEVEINLIPLQVNAFNNCKSELKYFEAGITGTISIASPTSVFTQVIRNGENGFLAKSYEWYEKIDRVLTNMDDYPELAKKAYVHTEENYSWTSLTGLIENTYLVE